MNREYNISHFPKLKNSQKMTIHKLNWEKLARTLTHPREIVPKKKQQLWSPTTFSVGRSKAHALWTDLLVFDVDDNNKYEDVQKKLQELGLAYIMHTTISHTEEHHKFRVILPLQAPVYNTEPTTPGQGMELWPFYYSRAIEYWKQNIGNEIDESCKDVSRAYFISYGKDNPLYRSDWSQGNPVCFLEVAQMDYNEEKERRDQAELERKIQLQKRQNYKNNRQKSHHSHTNWKKVLYDNLRDDPEYRATLAQNLGCTIRSGRAEGFKCPDCGRSDATFFYLSPIPYSSGFCGHRNSCGDIKGQCNSFSLYRLAEDNGLA